MHKELQVVEVSAVQSVKWFDYSLRQGFDLSAAVLASGVLDRGRFFAIVPEGFNRQVFDFAVGGVTKMDPAQARLRQCLSQIQSVGARSVIVEDELQSRSDPHVCSGPTSLSFIGERVVHWADLRVNENAAVETIDRGAAGYPLNAFVTTNSAAELGLVNHEPVPGGFVKQVMEGLVAVICAAFDAESYVLWTDQLDAFA
jgi:hypothetical protein